MKLYNSMGPNPRIVRMFLAEKDVAVETVEIDLAKGENRQAPFNTEVNRSGQLPALQLDDGSVIAEVTAICEYIEELHPDPVLVGADAKERALTRMWTRRIDLNIAEHLANGFRYGIGHDFFKGRMRLIPQAADDLIALGNDGLKWLNDELEGNDYITGKEFRMPDLLLFCWLDFIAGVGQELNPELKNIAGLIDRVRERSSVAASA